MVTGGNTALDPSRQSFQLQREGSLAFRDGTSSPLASGRRHPSHPRKQHCRNASPDAQPVTPSTIRHSNFIEHTFGETRRRVKVIGRLPGERSCLGLVWAVLDRASRGWRGVTMTPATVRQLQELRRQLLDPPTAGDPGSQLDKTVTAAA
jgi:hypothetical protein